MQDSYYKEHRLNLAQVVVDLGGMLGMSHERVSFEVPRTFAAIHPTARSYRSTFTATESLILLRNRK